MKSRRRYSTSESEGSAASAESASDSEPSSESEGSDSLIGERVRREKKHKRRAPSSGSASEEETRRRAKKRKHKKKKKKHGKKRRRNESASEEEEASESEGETKREILARANRNKHSYKNKSQSRSPSVQEVPERADRKEVRGGVRLQSVVKERRRLDSSPRVSPPSPEPHRYYDRPKEREYVRSASEGEYDGRRREEEVERFYRGSSKDRSQRSGQPRYQPETRYEEPERYDRYGGGGHNNGGGHEHYSRTNRSRDHGQYSNRGDRQPRYESRRGEDEYAREEHYRPHRDREFVPRHQPFHQHDDRGERPPRHFADKSGPVCLVCDEAHAGRECRRRPDRFRQPERDGRRDDRRGERRDVRREERRDERPEERPHDDKHVVVKREREERPSRGERDERGRVSRERREVSRGGSPARSPARREPRARSEAERPVKRERASPPAPPPRQRQRATRFNEEDGGEFTWGKTEVKAEAAQADKAKPDFALSGKLAADTNMVNGILLKYSEPPDAKQPKRKWRFYPFKGDKALPILYIHRQSCFVLGREHKAVDIPLEHPSVSKQHAALQYRATPYTRPDGTQARRVRPYIIDLDSANGTFVNNKKIETRRYVELLERDVVKFGFSQREYVLLHENSKDDGDDDNQEMGAAPAVGAAVTSIATVKREKQIKQEAREDGE